MRLVLSILIWSAAAGVGDGTHTELLWSKESDLITPLTGHSMEYVGAPLEKIVVWGGANPPAPLAGQSWVIDDSNRTTIVAGAVTPIFRYKMCSTVLFGTTTIIGGGGISSAGVEVVALASSADGAASWDSIASSGWTETIHACSMVSTGPGEIVVIGGQKGVTPIADRVYYNTVRRSDTGGKSWTDTTCSSPSVVKFDPQSHQAAVYMDDVGSQGRIVVIGGTLTIVNVDHVHNMVWYSDDKGSCWSQIAAARPFEERSSAQLVYVPRTSGTPVGVYPYGALILAGGSGTSAVLNDVWRSLDAGGTWQELTSTASVWAPRLDFQMTYSRKLSQLIVAGGYFPATGTVYSDVWTASYQALFTKSPTMLPTAAPTTPTAAPTTAPTITPTTAAPTTLDTNAPTAAPSSAPSASPTTLIGSVAGPVAGLLSVVEDGRDEVALLRIASHAAAAAALAADEVATIACNARDPSALRAVAPAELTMDSSGGISPAGTRTIHARGRPDALQLARRNAVMDCAVRTAAGREETYAIPLVVRGVAQPSFQEACPLAPGANPLLVDRATCRVAPSSNGNGTFVVIGGDCATCPQPPFDATTTVAIGGVACETTLVAGSGGTRLLVRTPSIAELFLASGTSAFEFTYYALTIQTPAGAQGDVGGEVQLGPGALTRGGGRC